MKIKLLLGAFAFIGFQSVFAQEVKTTTVVDSVKTVPATIDLEKQKLYEKEKIERVKRNFKIK